MGPFEFYVNSWYRNRLKLGNIFYCQVHLTRRCQNNCKHCYFRELQDMPVDFSFSDLQLLLEMIKNRSLEQKLAPRVDFTGGDPFLYPYLDEALELCSSLGIPYGFKGNPETILKLNGRLKKYILQSSGVSLSLDGLRETHDAFRSNGSFDRTIEAIHTLKAVGAQLRLNITISKQNINNLIPLLEFLLKEKIVVDDLTWARYWSMANSEDIIDARTLKIVFSEVTDYLRELFSKPSFYIRTQDNRVVPQIMFGFKEHQWYPFFVQSGVINPSVQEMVSNSRNCINCTATKYFYIIDPDLVVYKCRKLPESKVPFCEFGRESTCDYFGAYDIECRSCAFYNGCGGCSAITKCFTGSILQTEPFCPYKA